MNRFSLILVALVCLCFTANAQKVTFNGEVRDSLGTPLQFANVLAIDTVKNTMAAFGVTNQQGRFKLSLDRGTTYRLKVSFIGFLPFERVFTPGESNDIPYGIVLSSDVTQLGDVEVVSEMPVLIQGDTITYKADVFTQGNERKLEDVLEDLPGFEVDEDGGVKIQGKDVSKVLVDGKEFFEGDTKLATKNLPANVVDKVQVLQNYNNVGPLSGVNNSEQIALNIQLKEDKKNIVFGDISAGAGPEERYKAKANTFYYNPKTNLNLIAGLNNVGELTFTMRDYFRFTGGLGSFARGAGSSFQVSSNNLGIPMAERNNARDLKNIVGAFNYNLTPTNKWSFSGFAIGSKVDNTLGSVQQRTYILQPNSDQETLSSTQRVNSTSGLFKFAGKFTPNPSLQIDYSAFGRLSDISNSDAQTSVFGALTNDISGLRNQKPRSVEQQLRGFYAPNERDVFSFEASYQYQNQDPSYNLVTTGQPFASIIPMTASSPYDLTQLRDVTTKKQEAVLNYYRILNKTNHINFKVGNTYSTQTLTSNMFERLSDLSTNQFSDPTLVNLVDYTYQNYYLGLLYKTKLGKLVLTPALNLHYYDIANEQNGVEEGFDKTLLLPSVNAKYTFRSSHSLTLDYRVTAEFTDVANIAEGLLVRGYNTLFGGNANLQNSLYHSVQLNYFNFNMYNFFNVYGGLTYSKRFDDITNIVSFNNLERVNSPININTANEVLSGFASTDKRFDAWRFNFRANWSKSISNNIISDTPNENTSFLQSYRATISTTLFKSLFLDLGYDVSFNTYEGRNVSSQFENHKPFASLSKKFLKGFELEVEYEYNSYISSGSNSSTYDLLDANLTYRQDGSPWEFKIEGMNLMNTTGIRRDSFSESLISTFEYFIQKRYWLFSVMYDL
ncbi:carboxypeptidase-like regulatory domain-containing protein [Roseivirga sp. E12]|uniref:carboxypeptidase-like regulatory domain-containing protein n=1 Tax=Roseivirga sp. E12 TaxID=2819237 RepID=UPI001ABCA1C8|nr:carboxypeptidase-like regulatory domain-containing protein [Roseivirga sp. E12]MBO3699865.1 carboxypeptidase-like regulatory domain-containing protein [Roseivirga sp. E12]